MTRGTINSVPSVNGDNLDETEDDLSEITSKKNRERFAINKSYSIEVILILLLPQTFLGGRIYLIDFFEWITRFKGGQGGNIGAPDQMTLPLNNLGTLYLI